MRGPERLLVVLGLLAGCSSVHEPVVASGWAPAEAARPLHREDCVRLAVEFAPNAAAWRARLDAAEATLARASKLPDPTLNIGWEDFGLLSAAGSALQTTYTIGYSLAELFATSRDAGAARYERDAEIADLLAERRRLAVDVCTAYDRLVASRRAVALAEELAGIAARQREAADRRVAVGDAAPIVRSRAEAEYEEAEADVARRRDAANAEELAFAFALGFDRPVALELADDLLQADDLPVDDLEDLLAQAAATRPAIAAAEARYRAQLERLDLAVSRVQFLPTVFPGYRTLDGQSLGVAALEFRVPLFDAGGGEIAAQDAGLLAAAANLRNIAHETAREVASTAQQTAAAGAFLHDHAEPVAARRTALREGAARLFEAGQISFDEMLATRRDEVRAQQALLDASLALSQSTWPLRVDRVLARLDDSGR